MNGRLMPALSVCVILCIGLFPAFHLSALQLALVFILLSIAVGWRDINLSHLRRLGHWPFWAISQFLVMMLINAVIFTSWDGNRPHYRAVALESWSVTLLVFALVLLWLPISQLSRALWFRWLPVGLGMSFLIASGFYFLGTHQGRIWIYTPNPLIPPLWFLVITLLGFCWWHAMSTRQKVIRIALLILAQFMAVYGGSRVMMIGWVLAALCLAVNFYVFSPKERRPQLLIYLSLATLALFALIWLGNLLSNGFIALRFAMIVEGPFTYEVLSIKFERINVWHAALQVARDNIWLGVGQINERIAIHGVLGWDRWYRAHQTYLSYTIAGGLPLLVSGILFKAPVLSFLNCSMMPAFIGLGVILTLNEFTDSVMQSTVSVQISMLLVIFMFWMMKNE